MFQCHYFVRIVPNKKIGIGIGWTIWTSQNNGNWILKKCCDNHAYSRLMQGIVRELSNLSNKHLLKDTKAIPKHEKQISYHVPTACLTFFVCIFVFLD